MDGLKAIDMVPRDQFHWEARRYCEERRLDAESLPQIEAALRHSAFMDAIQPIIQMKCRIVGLAMPDRLLHPDDRVEIGDDGITEAMREQLAAADQIIASIARQYGLPQIFG